MEPNLTRPGANNTGLATGERGVCREKKTAREDNLTAWRSFGHADNRD